MLKQHTEIEETSKPKYKNQTNSYSEAVKS